MADDLDLGPGHRKGRWWVGPYLEGLVEGPPGRSVTIYDVSLREAPQCFPIVLDQDLMVELAEASYAVGVRRMEIWPVTGPAARESMKLLTQRHPDLAVYSPVRRDAPSDLELALQCGAAGVNLMGGAGWGLSAGGGSRQPDLERTLTELLELASRARASGLAVVAAAGDALRTPPDRLERYVRGLADGPVDAVVVNDSFGTALPEAVERLTRQVRSWVGPSIQVEIHCHDDFGMATANSVSAVLAGADVVHCTVNGYGERAGNANLQEVAAATEVQLGLTTHLDLSGFYDLARVASRITGVALPASAPLTGDWQAHEWAGMQAASRRRNIERGLPELSFALLPDVVGAPWPSLEVGPPSGGHAVALKASELGLDLPPELVGKVRDAVKREGERRRGPVPEEEFRRIVREISAGRSRDPA